MLAPPPLLPASLESPHSPVWPSQSQGHQRNSFRPAPRCPSSEAQWAALSARSEAAAVGSTLAAPSSLTHCVLQAHRPIAAPTGCPVGPVSPVPQASRLEVELAVTPGVPQAGKSRACRESGLTQTVRQDAPRVQVRTGRVQGGESSHTWAQPPGVRQGTRAKDTPSSRWRRP